MHLSEYNVKLLRLEKNRTDQFTISKLIVRMCWNCQNIQTL